MITKKNEHSLMISLNTLLFIYMVALYTIYLHINYISTGLLIASAVALSYFHFAFNENRDRNFTVFGYLICGALIISAGILAGYEVEGIPVYKTILSLF